MSREVGLGHFQSIYTSLIGVINSVFTIYEPNGVMAHLLTAIYETEFDFCETGSVLYRGMVQVISV